MPILKLYYYAAMPSYLVGAQTSNMHSSIINTSTKCLKKQIFLWPLYKKPVIYKELIMPSDHNRGTDCPRTDLQERLRVTQMSFPTTNSSLELTSPSLATFFPHHHPLIFTVHIH